MNARPAARHHDRFGSNSDLPNCSGLVRFSCISRRGPREPRAALRRHRGTLAPRVPLGANTINPACIEGTS